MSSDDIEPDDEGQSPAESDAKQKLSLEVEIASPGACQRHVTVKVAREDIDRYLAEAYDELAPKAEVPGFRPGRAPRKLVESRFKEQVTGQVKGSLLMDALEQVSEEHEFSAISEPDLDLDAVTLPDDGALAFEFDIEVRPDFNSPQWKGLKLTRQVREYTDDDVSEHLRRLLSSHGELVARDGPVEAGDALDVDVKVTDGDTVVSESKKARVRVLSVLSLRDATIDGFGDLMVGAEKGETRSIKITISDGATDEALRGKEVDVAFTVGKVNYIKLPELTQAYLEELGGFEDQDELLEAIREELERQAQYAQQRQLRQQITNTLTQDAGWDLPPELVKRQAQRELDRAVLELKSSGFSADAIQAHSNQIRQNSLRSTETALKEHFIFERIAEDEEIDATEADFDLEVELIARQGDESPRRVRARLEKRGQMDALRNQIIERKVVDLICSEADFEDVPATDSEEDTFAVDLALAGGHEASTIPEAKHGGEAEDLRSPVDHS